MSELFTEIKKDSINFRKEKSPFAVKTVHLISTIDSYVKDNFLDELSDDVVIKVVRSQIKKANDLKTILINAKADTSEVQEEIDWFMKFLPKEVSKEDIITVLDSFFETNEKSMKSMGKAMTFLKEKFGNALNPQAASSAVKSYIQ